jgi:hypothetical protein
MFGTHELWAAALAAALASGVALAAAERESIWAARDGGGSALSESAQRERLVWRHDAGHFVNTVGNRWVEFSPDGRHYFREVHRARHAIELYDGRRDCSVRLTDHVCFVRLGNAPYKPLYHGYWER